VAAGAGGACGAVAAGLAVQDDALGERVIPVAAATCLAHQSRIPD
jgi:hypothetical protein